MHMNVYVKQCIKFELEIYQYIGYIHIIMISASDYFMLFYLKCTVQLLISRMNAFLLEFECSHSPLHVDA